MEPKDVKNRIEAAETVCPECKRLRDVLRMFNSNTCTCSPYGKPGNCRWCRVRAALRGGA